MNFATPEGEFLLLNEVQEKRNFCTIYLVLWKDKFCSWPLWALVTRMMEIHACSLLKQIWYTGQHASSQSDLALQNPSAHPYLPWVHCWAGSVIQPASSLWPVYNNCTVRDPWLQAVSMLPVSKSNTLRKDFVWNFLPFWLLPSEKGVTGQNTVKRVNCGYCVRKTRTMTQHLFKLLASQIIITNVIRTCHSTKGKTS